MKEVMIMDQKDGAGEASWAEFVNKKKSKWDGKKESGGVSEVEWIIRGMTCSSCEARIQKKLEGLPGVQKAAVSYESGKAVISFNKEEISADELKKSIADLGYSVKGAGKEGFSGKQLIGIAVIMAALWLVVDRSGLFTMVPEINTNMGYGLIFIVGLMTSLHCVGMCGGINLSQSVGGKGDVRSRLLPGGLYNLGRLVSYTLVGGLAGAIGSVVTISGSAQGIVVCVAGAFMVLMGINMLGVFPVLKKLTPRLPAAFRNKVGAAKAGKGPFVVGFLNGFMPCGPLQSMQLYALGTGSFIAGALSMFLFSLGTIPLMFGLGALSSFLSKKFTGKMMKISAMLVLFLGVGMVGRGFSLSGISLIPSGAAGPANVAVVAGDVQTVESRVFSGSYEPVILQAGVPVRWTINVDADQLNGCNNPVTVPAYGIRKKLVAGENVIEFTPKEAGDLTYTCWMGMITSVIKVVDDIASVSDEVIAAADAVSTSGGGGCGGSGGGGCGSGGALSDPASGASAIKVTVSTDNIVESSLNGEIQEARILVDQEGVSPGIVVLKKGTRAKLDFYGEKLDQENYRVIVPAYNARMELKSGENIVEFMPEADFSYYNWTYKYFGVVLVEEDPSAADYDDLKKRAVNLGNYLEFSLNQKSSGSGGCCGG